MGPLFNDANSHFWGKLAWDDDPIKPPPASSQFTREISLDYGS